MGLPRRHLVGNLETVTSGNGANDLRLAWMRCDHRPRTFARNKDFHHVAVRREHDELLELGVFVVQAIGDLFARVADLLRSRLRHRKDGDQQYENGDPIAGPLQKKGNISSLLV